MKHPDRINDLELQNLLLWTLAEYNPIRLVDFLLSFLDFIEIQRSQSAPRYWETRSLTMLGEMQEIKRWIDGYYIDRNKRIPAYVGPDSDRHIFMKVTEEGHYYLNHLRPSVSRDARRPIKKSNVFINQQIPELVKNHDYPNPRSEETAKDRIAKAIAWRQGQQEFRQKLLDTYKNCLVTGCDAKDVLEAAHICPYSAGGTFDISNGLLLRADIHTLFDLGLIAIDTSSMTVILSSVLKKSKAYKHLYGNPLQFPDGKKEIPNRVALNEHRKAAGL